MPFKNLEVSPPSKFCSGIVGDSWNHGDGSRGRHSLSIVFGFHNAADGKRGEHGFKLVSLSNSLLFGSALGAMVRGNLSR